MPFDAVFDANAVAPKQGGGGHPVGNKFPFRITDTKVLQVEGKQAGRFEVEFSSDLGSVKHNYNLWNESDAARRISGEQLSALCHAVGIFKVDFKNDGAALRGARGLMDIGFQKGHEPSAEKPEGGYVELKKVYDLNGNEPGKAPQQQATQGGNGHAAGYQPQQSGFNPNGGANPNPPQNNAGGWNGGNAPQNNQPQTNNSGGWSQGGSAEKPPWG